MDFDSWNWMDGEFWEWMSTHLQLPRLRNIKGELGKNERVTFDVLACRWKENWDIQQVGGGGGGGDLREFQCR